MVATSETAQPWDPEQWNPAEYRLRYYAPGHVNRENSALITSLTEIWHHITHAKLMPDGQSRPSGNADLDLAVIGGGGTLWDIPAAAPHVKGICYTDPFTESRALVKSYLDDPTDHYWDAYVAHTLKAEGAAVVTEQMLEERAQLIRKKIKRVEHGDIYARPVIPCAPEGFPVVSAHFVLENTSNSKEVWEELMVNLGSLVMPRGCLLLCSLGMATKWHCRVKGGAQPATYLTPTDHEVVLSKMGFDTFYIRWIPAVPGEAVDDIYHGLIAIAATKTRARHST